MGFDAPPPHMCPKRMEYGPCGGVRHDGECEVGGFRCTFLDQPLVAWSGPPHSTRSDPPETILARMAERHVVITDLRVRPYDVRSVEMVAAALAPASDAVLIGEHHARPDFPPSLMAQLVLGAGARPWVTLTCRDRNRVVLESEVAALHVLGVEGVHAVTGDARGPSVRADATQVFDLDGMRLTDLARSAGLTVSVAETPAAPPAAQRPSRVVEKERAGAHLCFVNHAGGAGPVATFVDAARRAGATIPFIPCVPVFTDPGSAEVLTRFPGVDIDPAAVRRVLDTSDPVAAGIEEAVRAARAMLAIEGVGGVNLSGAATSGTEERSAEIMAAIGSELLRP